MVMGCEKTMNDFEQALISALEESMPRYLMFLNVSRFDFIRVVMRSGCGYLTVYCFLVGLIKSMVPYLYLVPYPNPDLYIVAIACPDPDLADQHLFGPSVQQV
jgi:hypothetical protein